MTKGGGVESGIIRTVMAYRHWISKSRVKKATKHGPLRRLPTPYLNSQGAYHYLRLAAGGYEQKKLLYRISVLVVIPSFYSTLKVHKIENFFGSDF